MNPRKFLKTAIATACLTMGLIGAIQAQASVVIAGTRVVYNAKDPEETLKLSNEGGDPALIQVWIDNGDTKASPSSINVPFTVTPPISRIDPNKGQTLRIIYTGEALPQNKESVFWLNVLEVPPKPGAEETNANKLQMAFRSRIKLFFRPEGLKGSSDDAPAQITWRLVTSDNQLAIEAHNPTSYFVSFTGLEVSAAGRIASFDDGGMVAPGKSMSFPLKGDVTATDDAKVHYQALNDFGGSVSGDATLLHETAQTSKTSPDRGGIDASEPSLAHGTIAPSK